jgi:hypothetical protein
LDSRETNAYSAEPFSRYVIFYYYGMLILVGSEVLPTNNEEVLIIAILAFLGTVFIGVVIGEFASILAAITKRERQVSEEIDIINNLMLGLRIPENLQNRVIEYHDKLSESQLIINSSFYKLLSHPFILEIKMFQTRLTVRKLDFLNPKNL